MPHSAPEPAASAPQPAASAPTPVSPATSLKDMVLAALAAVGGEAYLKRQAEENPRVFLSLLGKVLAAELRPKAKQKGDHAPQPIFIVDPIPGLDPLPGDPSPETTDAPPDPQAEDRAPARPSATRAFPIAPPQPLAQAPATRTPPLPASFPAASPYHVPPHKIITNLPEGHHPVHFIRPPPPPPSNYPW